MEDDAEIDSRFAADVSIPWWKSPFLWPTLYQGMSTFLVDKVDQFSQTVGLSLGFSQIEGVSHGVALASNFSWYEEVT